MGRSKLDKFDDNAQNDHIIEPGKPLFNSIKGKWSTSVFKNTNPIHLELACGRGEYSIGLGQKFPDQNYIGIDIKGSRIWTGGKLAQKENLKNVAFLRRSV